MILFEGKLYRDEQQDEILNQLWDSCVAAVSNRVDISEQVMTACGRVAEKIRAGAYQQVLEPLLEKGIFTNVQLEEAVTFFDRENLQLKYQTELGAIKDEIAHEREASIEKRLEPLGILFHIAAGNAEGLPFFSVIEGMLAGNVNILKLPSMDDGISILLLHEMIKEEPALAPYVCVLDVPSTNVEVLKKLGDMADAIVVWGGDAAVTAARTMASPSTQIISWGHKLSFAYVGAEAASGILTEIPTNDVLMAECDMKKQVREAYEAELYELAHHICQTKQLLCSSCQGIFVDTEDETVLMAIAKKFLNILEEVGVDYPQETIGVRGKVSISLYNEELESTYSGRKVLRGKGVSVVVAQDGELELSFMFKNCWVKPLPKKNIIQSLKGKKGYLQTVGLICGDEEHRELVDIFIKAGLTHIVSPKNMSQMLAGGTHDGEYPLRRYSRVVEVERMVEERGI